MIVSPRSLARKPLVLGLVIFGLVIGAVAAAAHVIGQARTERATALEESARQMDEERRAEKLATYTPPKPLCDTSEPTTAADEDAWVEHVDCLAERHRSAVRRLDAVTRGLDRWDSDRLRERRWEILKELGRWDTLVERLRAELQEPGLSDARISRGRISLSRALLKQSSEPWESRAEEAASLADQVEATACADVAALVYAYDAAGRDQAVLTNLKRYGEQGCAQRTDDGLLEVLMEQVGVGSVASAYSEAPDVVRDAPRRIASNFTIKSEFAICAAELPDDAKMRQRCEQLLESLPGDKFNRD